MVGRRRIVWSSTFSAREFGCAEVIVCSILAGEDAIGSVSSGLNLMSRVLQTAGQSAASERS